ncbi:hypothetical protein C8R44DRAFT_610519 [Mycena epipterygia]|nr:hypothetical protein C8R44DRAFT_610519 [Mycena epipterygia]
MHFLSALTLALTCFVSCAWSTTPAIIQPAEGTRIAPGQAFAFNYLSIADYGVSSYNYTVYLLTSPPHASTPSVNFGAGHYFGRFAEPNYPGNPNPSNPPPAQLVMPDFSKNPGGFGAGASATNATFYLAVFEEYADGSVSRRPAFQDYSSNSSQGSVGNMISFTANKIVYNGTVPSQLLQINEV